MDSMGNTSNPLHSMATYGQLQLQPVRFASKSFFTSYFPLWKLALFFHAPVLFGAKKISKKRLGNILRRPTEENVTIHYLCDFWTKTTGTMKSAANGESNGNDLKPHVGSVNQNLTVRMSRWRLGSMVRINGL